MTKPKSKVGHPRREPRLSDQAFTLKLTKGELERVKKASGYAPPRVWARAALLAAVDKVLGKEKA